LFLPYDSIIHDLSCIQIRERLWDVQFSRYSFYYEYIDEQVEGLNIQGNPTGINYSPINITSGIYFSDGNKLNATLRLS
jgi:hypothetical protein